MHAQLVVIAGPDKGRSFALTEGQTLVLGRGQASNTQLNDPRVSRVHCVLQVDGGKVRLTDSGSAAGTLVNGQVAIEHELLPGQVIQIGDTQLRYQLESTHDESTVLTTAPGRAEPKPEPANLEELVGQGFSVYVLESVLARGATGVVFKARDTEKNRTVAVKVLAPEFSGRDEQKERFIRAMQTMLPIRHENIVALYQAGKKGPYCWCAMEYVPGESLTQVIQRIGAAGMLDWQNAYRVAVHIGRALECAWENKIIHRNVTPQNILLRTEDKLAKLGDLMLAKALEGAQARQVTTPGQLVGDLAYMSPERTRDHASVDHRSDLYGLGATAYALLTGRPPFEARSLPQLVSKIRDEAPVPPKKFQLSIPDLLEGVVLKLLAKRPEERYQTPEELLKDLMRVGKYQGITV